MYRKVPKTIRIFGTKFHIHVSRKNHSTVTKLKMCRSKPHFQLLTWSMMKKVLKTKYDRQTEMDRWRGTPTIFVPNTDFCVWLWSYKVGDILKISDNGFLRWSSFHYYIYNSKIWSLIYLRFIVVEACMSPTLSDTEIWPVEK